MPWHIDDIVADTRLRTYRRYFDSFEALIDRERKEAKQQFRYAFFLRYYAFFENRLKIVCDRFAEKQSLPLRLADINADNFLKKVNKYLTHVAKLAPLDRHRLWDDVLSYLWIRNLLLHSDGRVSHPKDVPQYVGKQFHQRASGVKLDRHNTIRLNRNFCYRAVSRMALFLFDIAGQVPAPELWAKLDEAWK